MKNKKAFTLIELIAVLVILAILVLIVTPIVLNIIRHAKESANKRSVDAYGKSIELAVANYLLDKGEFPTNISDLEIEYSGKEVICNISLLNEDSSVYLSECKVGSSDVKDKNTSDGWYHYGSTKVTYKSYKIGDEVTYNGINFYVIENSDENSDSVTLLKEEPLTVSEVNKYGGVGTENNHVNKNTDVSNGTAYDQNGYGGMAYYSSETCGYTSTSEYKTSVKTGCTTDYAKSEVKYVVDAWALDKLKASDLKEDQIGYSARLITLDDLVDNLGYVSSNLTTSYTSTADVTPSWVYNSNYWYCTMSQYEDFNFNMWSVGNIGGDGYVSRDDVYDVYDTVRPVITIKKSAI